MEFKEKIRKIEKDILKNKNFLNLEKDFLNYIKTFDKDDLKDNFWMIDLKEESFIFWEKSFSLIFWDYEKSRYNWKNFSIRLKQKIFNKNKKEFFIYNLEFDNNFEYNDEFLIF